MLSKFFRWLGAKIDRAQANARYEDVGQPDDFYEKRNAQGVPMDSEYRRP